MNTALFVCIGLAGVVVTLLCRYFGTNWLVSSAVGILFASLVAVATSLATVSNQVSPQQPNEWHRDHSKTTAGPQPTLASLTPLRPVEQAADGYVQSDACRECHADQYTSWHASYHRTMTQVAHPDAVLGDFSNNLVMALDQHYRLTKENGVCWVEMNDPALLPTRNVRVKTPIVMTTGSHHMQVYWYATGTARTIGLLPLAFLKETEEWIPRSSAFLRPQPHHTVGEVGRWNSVCNKCHTTHPRERPRTYGAWDTQVSEFGISCEACHGSGQEHINYQRSLSIESPTAEALIDPIVNPSSLPQQRSADVCGQCHSIRTMKQDDLADVREHGLEFRPGDDLSKSFLIVQKDLAESDGLLSKMDLKMSEQDELRNRFYGDGMVRISGREYNAMQNSKCYQEGEMTCLSCHQLHRSDSDPRTLTQWADDQLEHGAIKNDACLRCHEKERYAENHTHHAADSSGSQCYNCHMPHTTYGLLKAIRSHTVSSPDISNDRDAGRPNACNLCHLDQTIQWSGELLQKWYGSTPPALQQEEKEVAAGVLWSLRGDAPTRALMAWHLGWDRAQQASGANWMAPYLTQLLMDDYPAIRYIARRSLRTVPGFEDLLYDPMAPANKRAEIAQTIIEQWRHQKSTPSSNRLLIEGNQLIVDQVESLLLNRDRSNFNLAE